MPVSDLCDEFNIQPTQFYQWQKVLFELKNTRKSDGKDRKIATLEEKQLKNEVLSELIEEHLALKKWSGDNIVHMVLVQNIA